MEPRVGAHLCLLQHIDGGSFFSDGCFRLCNVQVRRYVSGQWAKLELKEEVQLSRSTQLQSPDNTGAMLVVEVGDPARGVVTRCATLSNKLSVRRKTMLSHRVYVFETMNRIRTFLERPFSR